MTQQEKMKTISVNTLACLNLDQTFLNLDKKYGKILLRVKQQLIKIIGQTMLRPHRGSSNTQIKQQFFPSEH